MHAWTADMRLQQLAGRPKWQYSSWGSHSLHLAPGLNVAFAAPCVTTALSCKVTCTLQFQLPRSAPGAPPAHKLVKLLTDALCTPMAGRKTTAFDTLLLVRGKPFDQARQTNWPLASGLLAIIWREIWEMARPMLAFFHLLSLREYACRNKSRFPIYLRRSIANCEARCEPLSKYA